MSDPQQNAAAAPAPKTSNTKRRVLMSLIVLVVIIAAIAYGLYYFLIARFHESTDDAYVNGNIVQITPQVVGLVAAYEARKILPLKYAADMRHIALATIASVDALVSWNFKHIVNLEKIRLFNAVNVESGYRSLNILSPREVTTYEGT